MKAKAIPPRLFVLFAREAPVGVIFRRGPTRWNQLIHWNTANDVFTPGQWYRGNVYFDRSDVSPNGKLMMYFAVKHPHGDSITVISKPPYFSPLTGWIDKGTWGGGGLFEDNDSIRLHYVGALSEVFQLRTKPEYPKGSSLVVKSVWEEHLIRGGWKSLQRYNFERIGEVGEFGEYQYKTTPAILQKDMGFYTLQIEYAYDIHSTKYSIVDAKGNQQRQLDVTWAGVDQRKRFVFSKDGKIYAGRVDENFKVFRTELADFNSITKPDPQPAPEWAQKW